MASLMDAGAEEDEEDEQDEEQRIDVALDNAFTGLEKLHFYLAILSIFFMPAVLWVVKDFNKDSEFTAFGVFIGAIFTSVQIGVVFGIGRVVIGRRAMLFGNVIFCICRGLFMVSLFLAVYFLMPDQLKWVAMSVNYGALFVEVVIFASLFL
ncbi:uncharacterized protein LOC131068572 [Cryptomeria japonica]|uniref:uncharacterized protein LOC131068572 n=1 Tax=Cryptomeria japonica TaxID=3369 RepID=UPI0025AC5B3D|nr:uncharacterized protein LOC131068572 [Cryptomeria japonica]